MNIKASYAGRIPPYPIPMPFQREYLGLVPRSNALGRICPDGIERARLGIPISAKNAPLTLLSSL